MLVNVVCVHFSFRVDAGACRLVCPRSVVFCLNTLLCSYVARVYPVLARRTFFVYSSAVVRIRIVAS